jgi:hypothetical protein
MTFFMLSMRNSPRRSGIFMHPSFTQFDFVNKEDPEAAPAQDGQEDALL